MRISIRSMGMDIRGGTNTIQECLKIFRCGKGKENKGERSISCRNSLGPYYIGTWLQVHILSGGY